jgi:hypothetical protein
VIIHSYGIDIPNDTDISIGGLEGEADVVVTAGISIPGLFFLKDTI